MKNNKKNDGFFDGVHGQSLFHRPFIDLFRKNELPELFQKVRGLNDDRLLAIVTALLVEDLIDKIHSSFFPKYKTLLEATDFTFSMKINLLIALNFIPNPITNSAHLIRNIRNEFAHNLELTELKQLSNKILNKLLVLRNELYKDKIEDNQLAEAFKNISFYCIVGLDFYTPNITLLRSEFSSPPFIHRLESIVNQDLHNKLEILKKNRTNESNGSK